MASRVRLYLAPASAGKTAYVLQLARDAAWQLQQEVRVCVPTQLLSHSWRQRLAEIGGALGIRVMTFDRLYASCLHAAGDSYTQIGETIQYRLIRSLLAELSLEHYQSIADRPGLAVTVQAFIAELKAARIWPEDFLKAAAEIGDEPQLRDLGLIYLTYQSRLQREGWADRAGLGWLAVEALEQTALAVARDWPLVVVDGFDSFTEVQLHFLKLLAGRVGEMTITLTGAPAGTPSQSELRPVYRRFDKSCKRLEQLLAISAEPLPVKAQAAPAVLSHLEANLFADSASRVEDAKAVELIEATDRAAEVRAALRWLKRLIVHDGARPSELGLFARDLLPYRPFIVQTAAEFGLPVRLADGLPLRSNPAIAALLELLRLALPANGDRPGMALPRQGVVQAWRSPYFDWSSALPFAEASEPIGIAPGDADALDRVARWGRVIGGQDQWQGLWTALARRALDESEGRSRKLPEHGLAKEEIQALAAKFDRFLRRLEPPQGPHRYREFVYWLETLIGPDVAPPGRSQDNPTALNVLSRALETEGNIAELDRAALEAMKDVLRSLVWAEEGMETQRQLTFSYFLSDLMGTIEATAYWPPTHPGRDEILVANVIQARGIPMRAVALLGLAETEFPATLSEDPLLPERDRRMLRQRFGLPIDSSIESAEREFFYEAITRPWERLLLTRPRLADTGAEWLPSPFWEEIRRLVDLAPLTLTTESAPLPNEAASMPELLVSMIAHPGHEAATRWVAENDSERWAALMNAGRIFRQRYSGRRNGARSGALAAYDGDLTALSERFARHFHADYGWSPSGLESYRTCPYSFFVARVLGLQPRPEPVEGLDGSQLGTLYHSILEALYGKLGPAERVDTEQLLATLPAVARPILDGAPERLGFRETAWWRQTRLEIQEVIARSIKALAELQEDFVPTRFEARFFGEDALLVSDGGDHFRLHGLIDRIDQDAAGRLRIIDYKTPGPYNYDKRTLDNGKKLQLPLYALAARDALALGEPVDGFYWHLFQAQASGLRLSEYGPAEAIEVALDFAWNVVHRVRQGHFVPEPPADGCPGYCPAANFCWHYRSGFRG